jgi:EAL domain-containing protein (putative c-di-GMP-specific phosphodiesterase class I)
MPDSINEPLTVAVLKEQLREALFLDLDEYGLEEPHSGQFISTFLGIELGSAFQPIYDSEAGELYGHEALLRASLGQSQAVSPEFAFGFAEQSGRLVKFDRICRTLHLLNFRRIFAESGLLFLNVHPELLLSVNAHGRVFERILHAHSVPTRRVVIEIRESAIEQSKRLEEAVENYRERGYRIAIDGFGRKHTGLTRLWKLTPDFVKLDHALIAEAAVNKQARRALPHIVELIRALDAQPVIQGIETQAQLEQAILAGSTLLQGNFLGLPASARELQLRPSRVLKPTVHKLA